MILNLLCFYCYIIFSATGCQVIQADPAHGRSPGPPPPPPPSIGNSGNANAYTNVNLNQTMHNGTFEFNENVNSSELSNNQQNEEKIIKSSNKLKTFINQINTSKFNNQKKNLESLRSESDKNIHCKRVDTYVGGDEEKIVNIERGNDEPVSVPFTFDVIHDLFDTQRGLINGLIYTVGVGDNVVEPLYPPHTPDVIKATTETGYRLALFWGLMILLSLGLIKICCEKCKLLPEKSDYFVLVIALEHPSLCQQQTNIFGDASGIAGYLFFMVAALGVSDCILVIWEMMNALSTYNTNRLLYLPIQQFRLIIPSHATSREKPELKTSLLRQLNI